ncbi:MAG TPA: L-2-hydroxyglutarate oxidase, partial [Phycicoccus sp.]
MSGRRVVVVGGGIVGLAVAERLVREEPSTEVTVVEKEPGWARHQTGRNSGVIHSGLYYAPGSAKARWCRSGVAALLAFAREEGIPHAVTGKLVVATDPSELARMQALLERGLANGLGVRRIEGDEARELEPHVAAIAALHVPETGIIDYTAVCAALVGRLERVGARLRTGAEVLGAGNHADGLTVETTAGPVTADLVVNCAGLHADRLARLLGHEPSVRIVPFRGEYRELTPEATHLVRGLVYPVPDPELPFLGVHLTRGIGGHVHAGPNAVLA